MAKTTITEDMCIGTVIESFPSTEPVFKKFFGDGCFTCPGAKNEDISFGAMMHNVELATVLKELNDAVTK
jgi:hybrid cluster-associated redox disulfide protein